MLNSFKPCFLSLRMVTSSLCLVTTTEQCIELDWSRSQSRVFKIKKNVPKIFLKLLRDYTILVFYEFVALGGGLLQLGILFGPAL